jgi:hypothetical protein
LTACQTAGIGSGPTTASGRQIADFNFVAQIVQAVAQKKLLL